MNYFIQIISRRTFARTAFSALHQPKLCAKLPYLPRVYLPNKTVIAQFVSQRLKQQFKLNNAGLFKRQQLNRNNRRFHTSLSKIYKLGAILLKRSLRKLNPQFQKLLFADERTEKIIKAFVVIFSVLYFLIHAKILRSIASYHPRPSESPEYKIALGRFGPHILPVNHPDHIRVYQVTKRLVSYNQCIEMEGIKWNVNVVDTPDSNAFVLPDGQIFMFKGLLDKLDSDSTLAAVLGHEMAHVLLKHVAERDTLFLFIKVFLAYSLLASCCPLQSAFAIGVLFFIQILIIEILLYLPFLRQVEKEADEVGMLLAAKACFDVRESTKLLRKLAEQQWNFYIEWLLPYPSHKNRVIHLDSLLPEALQIRRDCNCPALDEFLSTVRDYQPRLLKLLSEK